MVFRRLMDVIEPITMDGSIGRDFQMIAQASSHIGEQMYADLMFSFHIGTFFQYFAVVVAM